MLWLLGALFIVAVLIAMSSGVPINRGYSSFELGCSRTFPPSESRGECHKRLERAETARALAKIAETKRLEGQNTERYYPGVTTFEPFAHGLMETSRCEHSVYVDQVRNTLACSKCGKSKSERYIMIKVYDLNVPHLIRYDNISSAVTKTGRILLDL